VFAHIVTVAPNLNEWGVDIGGTVSGGEADPHITVLGTSKRGVEVAIVLKCGFSHDDRRRKDSIPQSEIARREYFWGRDDPHGLLDWSSIFCDALEAACRHDEFRRQRSEASRHGREEIRGPSIIRIEKCDKLMSRCADSSVSSG